MSNPGADTSGDRPLPLVGVTVLDLGQIYQGPYCGFLLAMSGARVIKVEQTRGEPLRARGPSLPYAMLNSCKETVTVNLKDTRGRDLLRRLATRADVMVVNYAPGVPERLGIAAADMWEVNNRLIYAHGSGFGLDGADKSEAAEPPGPAIPAMDITVQAHMGAIAVTGSPDSPPVKAGIAFVDFLGGTHLYGAVTTALFERQRTGRGRMVETAMSEAAYMSLCTVLGSWEKTGEAPRRGNKHAALGVAPYDLYECCDGWVALIAVTNRHWRSVLDVIGRPDLLGDQRYADNADRAKRMDEVDALVSGWTTTHTRADAAQALQAAHVPAAAVREVDEVVRDPDAHQRRALQWTEHPEIGRVPLPHSPIRWHDSALAEIEPSRPIGADNDAIFGGELGVTEAELADLRADRVI
ncbi:MAG: CoA transferase [Actinomycetia bacterium]|nr:CoA transferase [Actinomycetes bacterium]